MKTPDCSFAQNQNPTSTQRVKTYNKLLRAASRTERLVQEKVLEKSGLPPVVGTKEVFRELYKLL